MRTALNPFMYGERSKLDWVETLASTTFMILQPGDYKISICGGGGAGGGAGGWPTNQTPGASNAGGPGGGGGNGNRNEQIISLPYSAKAIITVGEGGHTAVNGGNGGLGGQHGWRGHNGVTGGAAVNPAAGDGGPGGGGGFPSIVKLETRQNADSWGMGLYTTGLNNVVYDVSGNKLSNWSVVRENKIDAVTGQSYWPTFTRNDGYVYIPTVDTHRFSSLPITLIYYADGGGGGGGGGGCGACGRYVGGAGGGGGGGRYIYDATNGNIISVPGKSGGGSTDSEYSTGTGFPGQNGDQSIGVSGGRGGGGTASNGAWGEGGYGAGAGGGGGKGGHGNHSSSTSGSGGGGAGGSWTAHGGNSAQFWPGIAGTNPGTTGTSSVDPWGKSISGGGGFGAGGNVNQNGGLGWVRIQQL